MHLRSPRRYRLAGFALKLGCAVLLLGGGEHARQDACNGSMALGLACAEPVVAAAADPLLAMTTAAMSTDGSKTVVTPVRAGLLPAPRTLDAAPLAVVAAPSADFNAALTPGNGDSSVLGLVIAALGVVGYVAHRRSGR